MYKWLYGALTAVTIAPLIIAIIAVLFLPDSIPSLVHDRTGELRYGSKYAVFVFPAISLILGIIFIAICRWVPTEIKDPKYEMYLLVFFTLSQLIWVAMICNYTLEGFQSGY